MLTCLIALFLYGSPGQLYHFRQPPVVAEFSHFSTSFPVLAIIYLFIFSQSDNINLGLIAYVCPHLPFSMFPVGLTTFSFLVSLVSLMCRKFSHLFNSLNFSTVYFAEQQSLTLTQSNLVLVMCFVLWVILFKFQKSFLIPKSQRQSPTFSSFIFMVLCITFRPSVYLEFTSVSDIRIQLYLPKVGSLPSPSTKQSPLSSFTCGVTWIVYPIPYKHGLVLHTQSMALTHLSVPELPHCFSQYGFIMCLFIQWNEQLLPSPPPTSLYSSKLTQLFVDRFFIPVYKFQNSFVKSF